MYKIEGINPKTGHQWNLLSGINLNYIPRTQRKIFTEFWSETMRKSNGNSEFTWQLVQYKFPYLELACRRYMIKPVYRLQNVQYIPFDNVEDVVVSTWSKDFSNKLKIDLAAKMARAVGRGETLKDKFKKKWGGFGSSFYSFAKNLFKRK